MANLPLNGIRIIDSTYVFALPYAGGQLSDLGAEVIKVEGPGRPDITRSGGLYGSFPDNVTGEDWWNRPSTFNLLNRGKRSLTLDMSSERGRDLFREMVSVSDIVMENFTPRVMKNWGLDYPNLKKIKPDIILVSNTGYGHGDGPYSSYPAQATTQEGTHGHCWVTGYVDGEPSKAGRSFVDFLSTWSAVFAIGAALRYRNLTGKGQWVDISMYQAGAMFLSEYLMDSMVNKREGTRIGNRHPHYSPQGCYPSTGDNQWIVLSISDETEWSALCNAMGHPELETDKRFTNVLLRKKNHNELDKIIAEWTRNHDRYDLMHKLQSLGIAAAPVLAGQDVHFDPHYKDRNFLERVQFPEGRDMGTRILMGRPFKFSNTPMQIRHPAPEFGEGNEYYLKQLLGIRPDAYDSLVQDAIISSVPTAGEPSPTPDPAEALARGQIATWDPEYRDRLGIS